MERSYEFNKFSKEMTKFKKYIIDFLKEFPRDNRLDVIKILNLIPKDFKLKTKGDDSVF